MLLRQRTPGETEKHGNEDAEGILIRSGASEFRLQARLAPPAMMFPCNPSAWSRYLILSPFRGGYRIPDARCPIGRSSREGPKFKGKGQPFTQRIS